MSASPNFELGRRRIVLKVVEKGPGLHNILLWLANSLFLCLLDQGIYGLLRVIDQKGCDSFTLLDSLGWCFLSRRGLSLRCWGNLPSFGFSCSNCRTFIQDTCLNHRLPSFNILYWQLGTIMVPRRCFNILSNQGIINLLGLRLLLFNYWKFLCLLLKVKRQRIPFSRWVMAIRIWPFIREFRITLGATFTFRFREPILLCSLWLCATRSWSWHTIEFGMQYKLWLLKGQLLHWTCPILLALKHVFEWRKQTLLGLFRWQFLNHLRPSLNLQAVHTRLLDLTLYQGILDLDHDKLLVYLLHLNFDLSSLSFLSSEHIVDVDLIKFLLG